MSQNDPPLALFRRLTNGLYVVGVAHGSERDAFTAAWITQVSFDPLLVALSVNPGHASFPLLAAAGAFAVSILGQGQLELARHFGTQSGRSASTSSPINDGSRLWVVHLSCRTPLGTSNVGLSPAMRPETTSWCLLRWSAGLCLFGTPYR